MEDQALAWQGLGLIKPHSLQFEKAGARPGAFSFSLSPITGRVSVVAVAPPGTISADLARPIIGPDHAAVAMPVAIVSRIAVIGRRNIEASMEVTPVMEEGPVVGVTVSVAITAAIDTGRTKTATPKDGRCAEAAPVDRHPTAPEPAAAKRRAAASKAEPAARKPPPPPPRKPPPPRPPPPCLTSVVSPSVAYFAAGAVPGLASDNASARCCDAASANKAAAVTPRQRTRPRPASDIAIDKSSLTGDALRVLQLAIVASALRSRYDVRDIHLNAS